MRASTTRSADEAERSGDGVHGPTDGTSTLGSLSENDFEGVVGAVFGSSPIVPSPRRFSMEDMVKVDEKSLGLLQVSSLWKSSLPHIKRVVETERLASTENANFVARTFRQRPGVVYAVRYWEGLADATVLTLVLKNIRNMWCSSTHSMCKVSSNQGATKYQDGKDDDRDRATTENTREARHKSPEPPDCQVPASVDQQRFLETPVNVVPGDCRNQEVQGQGLSPTVPQTVEADGAYRGAIGGTQSDSAEIGGSATRDGPAGLTSEALVSLPEDTLAQGCTQDNRSSPLRMLGFATKLDSSLREASVALVSEWPGIGSLHDLLSGNVQLEPRASQEDLLRWTRQVAESLLHASRSGCSDGCGDGMSLRISTRNVYLFRRPQDELQEGADMFDVRVAAFFGGCSMPGRKRSYEEQGTPFRCVLPPEIMWATPDAGVSTSPTKFRTGRRQASFDREAADVWGFGTFVFELATGQVAAGPVPLAFRQLRDLLRDVPIDPRFIYGDIARGVMRLALKNQPGRRARACEITAAVEQIAARTLRRAHTAQDRISRQRRAVVTAAAGAGTTTGEKGTDEDDGYGLALAQWRINEAVERAGGRARAFLRQLWFNSLTEDDKRRIRHRRRHRKANREAREWRGRRVRAAKIHHWTPVEVASWISHLLQKAETSGKLPLLFSGNAKGGTTSMGGDDTGAAAAKNRVINPTEENAQESGTAANPTPEEGGGVVDSSDTTPVKTEGSSSPAAAPRCDSAPSLAEEVKKCSGVLADAQDSSIAGVGQAQGDDNYDKNAHDGGHGDVNNKDDDDDDLSSSVEKSNNGWAEVEAGERTGYSGAAVEPFAVKEGINGCCIMEAMEDALGHTEDALTRFIKSSTRLARPTEVEQKRVELMVRELLTIRPY
ncbi:unnamed protein product, partial [Ectocarpus sp. 12 AP-2014]